MGFIEFYNDYKNYIDLESVVFEIYKDYVFPEWFQLFETNEEDPNMKISKIRENVENGLKIIDNMQNEPIETVIVDINKVLNIVHVSGTMLHQVGKHTGQYVSDLYDFFEDMSNMDTYDIDQDLRNIGLQV